MLTLSSKAMEVLFSPTLSSIILCISEALTAVAEQVSHMFLVGGFAESALLQHSIRNSFEQKLKVTFRNLRMSVMLVYFHIIVDRYPKRSWCGRAQGCCTLRTTSKSDRNPTISIHIWYRRPSSFRPV